MVLTVFELVSALCTLIAIVCASDVLITATLTFLIPHFLWFTEIQVPICAGIVAGFVTIPTVLRIKTSKSSPHVDRVFGYTVCYQRLAVLICIALHVSATVTALTAALTTQCWNKKMLALMRKYHCKPYAKELIDNIQLSLQCCGARTYRDWYRIDWSNTNFDGDENRGKSKQFYAMLRGDTEEYPDFSTIRTDHVPYSCCSRRAMAPCVHQNLIHFGTHTINRCGCDKMVLNVILTILYAQFGIYVLCLLLELLVLILLKPVTETLECKKCQATITENKYMGVRSYSKFANDGEAELTPSSQTELRPTYSTTTAYPYSTSSDGR